MYVDFYTLEVRKFGQAVKQRAQTWRRRMNLTKNSSLCLRFNGKHGIYRVPEKS